MKHLAPLSLLFLPALAFSQVMISNPGLPTSERLTYSDRIGTSTRTIDQTLLLRSEGATKWYEFQTHAFDSDLTVRLDPKSMFISSIEAISRTKDAVLHRQLDVVQVLRKPEANELVVNDLATLPIVLRGFPWGKMTTAKLVYLGANAASGDYSFELNVMGQESVLAGGRTTVCWKAQIGLAGIYGPFFSKTTLWYDTKPPHVLVKAELATGGPGSPVRTQELVRYEASN